jgi:hypothetical protein
MIDPVILQASYPITCDVEVISSIAAWSENRLRSQLGFSLDEYSTARMLSAGQRDSVTFACEIGGGIRFEIEFLPKSLHCLAESQGTVFMDRADCDLSHLISIISKSLSIIHDAAPGVFESVRQLLRVVHVLFLEDDDYDVSFTLPELPHSIFISIPQQISSVNILRLAEAIVHEVMHLQLSIIETRASLVRQDTPLELTFAPWRGEERPISGVIHGLFVFRTIEHLYTNYLKMSDVSDLAYVKDRLVEIAEQRLCINNRKYNSLTEYGSFLLATLLKESTGPAL